jgi:hypothetical protein
MKKYTESFTQQNLSSTLLENDTQPWLELDEVKEVKEKPVCSSSMTTNIVNEARELPWNEISDTKRVRIIVSPMYKIRVEFKLFNDNVPSDRGIFLNLQQFDNFSRHFLQLESVFTSFLSYGDEENYRTDLGRLIFAEFNYNFPCIQIRRYYEDRSSYEQRPTRQGITFSIKELQSLKSIISDMQITIGNMTAPPSFYVEYNGNGN